MKTSQNQNDQTQKARDAPTRKINTGASPGVVDGLPDHGPHVAYDLFLMVIVAAQ